MAGEEAGQAVDQVVVRDPGQRHPRQSGRVVAGDGRGRRVDQVDVEAQDDVVIEFV